MRLGPDGFNKIAIMGTAASSMELAPFDDQSWAIWACSPGAYPTVAKKRCDVWFETHRWQPTPPGQIGKAGTKPWFSAEYHAFLKEMKGPVFMSTVDPTIPNCIRIPFEALIDKYGPYFWTSTLAYMLGMAIDELQPRAANGEQVSLGLFGVDMATNEEWAYQRPGCQHFVGLAMSLGINVVLPQESDLMRPQTMYGIGELSSRHVRFLAKRAELQANFDECNRVVQEMERRKLMLQGAIGEVDYVLQCWTDDIQPDLKKAVSFSSEYTKPVGALKEAAKALETTGAEVTPLKNAL